jgi:hypothetical protein
MSSAAFRPPSTHDIFFGVVSSRETPSSSPQLHHHHHHHRRPRHPVAPKNTPLHSRLVTRIDYAALCDLPCKDPLLNNRLREQLRWLTDPEKYNNVPVSGADSCPSIDFSDKDITTLCEHGILIPVDPAEVLGPVKLFAVYEITKNRRRVIKWPYVTNFSLGKAAIDPDMSISGKKATLSLVLRGKYYADLDGAQFFDQMPLHPDVGRRMCCRHGDKYYRLGTNPMGLNIAVQCAQRTMQVIMSPPDLTCHTGVCVDNGILVHETRAAVEKDLAAVLRRAESVNCTIKDPEDIQVHTWGEWGGVAFDLSTKEVWLTDKISIKLELSWARRHQWSYRGFQAHVGLLSWAIGILDLNMTEYFDVLRFISRVGFEMAEHPERWDEPINIWPSAMASLTAWTNKCLDNQPHRLEPNNSSNLTWVVCTDACRFGWGYVALNIKTGEVRQHGERWRYSFFAAHHPTGELGRSVFTEPHGLHNSLRHLLQPRPGEPKQHVIVGTDNIATRAGFARGYNSVSFSMNKCIEQTQKLYKDYYTFEFRYIAGSDNVHADAMSRGTSTSATRGHITDSLRQWAGVCDDNGLDDTTSSTSVE